MNNTVVESNGIVKLTETIKEETEFMKVSRQAVGLCDQVKSLVVIDQDTYFAATDLYKALVAMEKEIQKTHEKVIGNWFQKHRAACADRDKDLIPVSAAKVLAKSKAAKYQDEQEAIRLAEERRLQAEQRRIQAEQEKAQREAQEAERKRLEAIEEADRLRLAEEAEAMGASHAEVTEILETPLAIPEVYVEPAYQAPAFVAPSAPSTFQKAAGFSSRMKYSGKIINLEALVDAAHSNRYFMQFLEGNESAINSLASSAKDKFQLPGCCLSKVRV